MGLGFLVANMQSVCFPCVVIVLILAFENVNPQVHRDSFYRQYTRNRRPAVVISSRSGVKTYLPQRREATENVPRYERRPNAEKINLDVYYETDCPDSMRFLTRQLYPLYQEMGDVVDINLVPYGKAHEYYNEEKQEYSFSCQHGPSECFGNTVQSCVISLYPNKKDHFDFIHCMESYPRPSRNAPKCARRLSLDWAKIEKCAKGEEGNRLMHKMAEKTESLNPRLYFVPWIVIDKVFSESTQRTALRNLKGVVCDAYKGNHTSCEY